MCKICIFAGTTEARRLVELLSTQPVSVTACVATEYGETLLPEGGNVTVRSGVSRWTGSFKCSPTRNLIW